MTAAAAKRRLVECAQSVERHGQQAMMQETGFTGDGDFSTLVVVMRKHCFLKRNVKSFLYGNLDRLIDLVFHIWRCNTISCGFVVLQPTYNYVNTSRKQALI